ncbi:MAG: PEP/pyruvate-binding domain-containing protein [Arenicellales bacterium]|nr:PEP/pyruvate-binding domain-containing protein [Arenicellales bacterium]
MVGHSPTQIEIQSDLHQTVMPLTTSLAPIISLVGGKAASLIRLKQAGFTVPDGFVLTSDFFAPWVESVMSSSEWQSVRARLGLPGATGLRELCEATKSSATKLSFSETQRTQLEEISISLGNRRLVVRSSSPEEDLSGASFAGLYKTLLNTTSDTLEIAVRACFESCLDERVLLYKRESGFKAEAPSIAVIIQVQIPSEVSGVAFSLNPLTNDFDQVVVNAAQGHGEAVVSGDITPDKFVIDKTTGKIIERRAGSKGGNRSANFCLSNEQLAELAETLKAIEDLYATPVDVEWTFATKRLHVLQARPVTAYVPLPPEMQTKPGEPRLLFIDGALSKGLTLNAAITPMTCDLVARLIRLAAEALLGKKDITLDPKSGLLGVAGARVYMNLSNVLHLFNTQRLINNARYTDALAADILETHDLEAYRPLRPPPHLRLHSWLLTAPKVFWRLRGFMFELMTPLFRRKNFYEKFHTEVASFEQAIAEPPNFELPIDEFLRHYYTKLLTVVKKATAPALILFVYFGTERLEKLIDHRSEVQRTLLATIKRGYSNELVVEMGTLMYQLSTLLPRTEYEDIDTLAYKVEHRTLPEAFLSMWDRFITRFGCRGPLEMELANPKYGDDPKIALRQIAAIAKSGGAFDPRRIHQQHVEERELAYAKLHAQIKGRKRRKLERSYRNIVEFGGARDTPKYHIMLINNLIRQRLLTQAETLVTSGRLKSREQIFELNFDDLEEATWNLSLDLQTRVRERGHFYRKAKALVKRFPTMIDSRGFILRPIRPVVAGALSGTAVSPGVVRGPVKVLDNPFEKAVAPGDVLVAYTTDPGWTPLFINTAAVILEVGGELQHGALVAREYGKPCVVGIAQVTAQLHDGQVVEVDGNSGVVRMIKAASTV